MSYVVHMGSLYRGCGDIHSLLFIKLEHCVSCQKYTESNVRHNGCEGTQWMCGHNTAREAISSEYVINIVFDVIDRVIVSCNTHSECDIIQSR